KDRWGRRDRGERGSQGVDKRAQRWRRLTLDREDKDTVTADRSVTVLREARGAIGGVVQWW
ncbi:hypothetical protein PIB30_075049, partial [Stylosanthes scabra]|nr:hypothetical protein [Stylosanthes scabra]